MLALVSLVESIENARRARRDAAEKKENSRKDLPATLRAALAISLHAVCRVAMQAGAKALGNTIFGSGE